MWNPQPWSASTTSALRLLALEIVKRSRPSPRLHPRAREEKQAFFKQNKLYSKQSRRRKPALLPSEKESSEKIVMGGEDVVMGEEDHQRRCRWSKILLSEKMSSAAMREGFGDAGEGELEIIVIIVVAFVIDVAGIIVDGGGGGDPLRGITVLDLDYLLLILFLSASFFSCCCCFFCLAMGLNWIGLIGNKMNRKRS